MIPVGGRTLLPVKCETVRRKEGASVGKCPPPFLPPSLPLIFIIIIIIIIIIIFILSSDEQATTVTRWWRGVSAAVLVGIAWWGL